MCDCAQLIDTVLTEICAFGKVLPQQAISVFVAPALPGALRVAEIDFQTRVDLELRMLGHLRTLIPSKRSPKNRNRAIGTACQTEGQ